jgi:hypothetical protein
VNRLLASLPLALALCSAAAPAAPPITRDRAVAEGSMSSDSDGLHERTADVGYIWALPKLSTGAILGLREGYWLMDSPSDRVEFGTLAVDHQSTLGPLDLALHAKQAISHDWSPTLGGADLDFHLAPRLSIDIGGDADLVDTVIAARRHTRVNTGNVSADFRLLDSLTLVGGVLEQWFSDGNHRFGRIGKLVWSPSWLEGFNAQLRVRRIDSEFTGIGYFSPARLEEALALLQYGHALPGGHFVLTGQFGGGAQRVDGANTAALYQAELRTRGWFTDHWGMEAKAGCTNTGGLQVQAATGGYRYCYGNLDLIRSF